MNTKDFVCSCLGLYGSAEYLDEICDAFDLDLTDDEVEEAVGYVVQSNFQIHLENAIADMYYQQVIRDYVEQGLDEDKFEYCCNGSLDTWLHYDGELITCKNDLNELVDQLEEGWTDGGKCEKRTLK